MKTPRMSRQHFEFIADNIAPMLSWPTHIKDMADLLAASNPNFNREKFIARATKCWEDNYLPPEVDDYIPLLEELTLPLQ